MDASNLSLKTTALIIISVISGMFVFVLGGFAGITYQSQKSGAGNVLLNSSNTPNALASSLRSEIVGSILLFGQVEKISGKTIEISKSGKTIPVLMTDGTKYILMDYTAKTPVQKKATIDSIKVGDTLSVSVKLLEDNSFSGKTVTIYPSGSKNIE
jgi:hypothetical protein